jgi:hypothetical protein
VSLDSFYMKHVFTGQIQDPSDQSSCNSLKRSGVTKPGIYNLMGTNDKYPRLAYCHMDESDGYNGLDIETSLGYLDPRSLPGGVLFSAQIFFTSRFDATQPIVFDKTILNIGDAFEPTTGMFTAPTNAVYQFMFSANNYGSVYTYIEVHVNGEVVFQIKEVFSSGVSTGNKFGHNWSMNLNNGDTMQLILTNGYLDYSSDYAYPIVLIGQLVSE